jgi:HlyD family secretion protein
MGKKLLIAALLIILAGVAIWFFFVRAKPGDEKFIRAYGNIEAIEIELSFRIPGWVAERPVDEGYSIKRDQLIAKLDTVQLEQHVAAEKANVDLAQAALAELLTGSRPEDIASAEAQLQQAQHDVKRLEFEYNRDKTLYEQHVVAQSDWQLTEYTYLIAVARQRQLEEQYKLVKAGPRQEEIDQAKAALDQANENYSLVKEGPRIEEINQARARLDQAKQSLAVAQSNLGYGTLPSPVSGVVLSKNVEAGEYVSPGTPVVTVADIENIYLRAYINETDLGRVKLGQHVRVTTDTYPGKVYDGAIAFISDAAEFTPKNVQTTKERVKLVYRIKVNIHNPTLELKPGMPADADIELAPPKAQ